MPTASRSPRRYLLVCFQSALVCALILTFAGRGQAATKSEASPARPSLNFELDVMPVLTVAGCNQGACHGKSRGQNGFQLSLLGFDADFDYATIVKEGRGRRVFPSAPEESLLLRKAAAQVPHGGGERLPLGSANYETLRLWIERGMPRALPTDPVVKRIAIAPSERPLAVRAEQPLTVTAHYSDGSMRDVTTLAAYQSNETAVAAISQAGVIKAGSLPGETAIMARYMGHIATWTVVIPQESKVPANVYASLPRYNRIDDAVWKKLAQLGITPSPPANDATFLRRATLDIIGRIPTPEEVRVFLADKSPDKRERLIDSLLGRLEYADYWANKWADLLRPNPYHVGVKATFNFDAWIRDAFRQNMPYDQFVRELVTAQGSTWTNGAVTMFRDRRKPDELTTLTTQLFLGIRLDCAKCHHHPFEVWGQDEFYGMAAYFSRVGFKGTGISAPISGGEEMIFTRTSGSVTHPLTGAEVAPKPLFGEATPAEGEDPRVTLARWMTSEKNPYFANVAVNRVWTELMGRGIVEPVDDLRATNPPTNAALMNVLAEEFRAGKYDLKKLIRTITTSYVYGLSSLPGDHNVTDARNYSRHYRVRLRAEVLLDAVCDATESPESYDALPPQSRAMALWTHRGNSLFLDAFGRPDPNQDPPCERTPDTTMVQALHLMNAPALHQKVTSDTGRAAKLAASDKSSREIVEELYLASYSRLPTAEELAATEKLFPTDKAGRRTMTEDLLWALLNSPEFIFKD
jgi:hypothetical protein